METEIQLKINSIIDALFDNADRNITVQRMPDGKFKAYITSTDPLFLSMIIGKGGETIKALRTIFQIWSFRVNIKLQIWIEKNPIKKYND